MSSTESEKTEKTGKVRVRRGSLAETIVMPSIAIHISANQMTQWDNEAHMKLCIALNDVLIAADASVAKHKDVLMASLAASNSNFTWEGVR